MTSPSLWPLIAAHFDRWKGQEPLAVAPGIRMLEQSLGELDPKALDPERWGRLVQLANGVLARLIELGASGDATIATTAQEGAGRLAPLMARMTSEATPRLAKAWRAA